MIEFSVIIHQERRQQPSVRIGVGLSHELGESFTDEFGVGIHQQCVFGLHQTQALAGRVAVTDPDGILDDFSVWRVSAHDIERVVSAFVVHNDDARRARHTIQTRPDHGTGMMGDDDGRGARPGRFNGVFR